ncbi:succinate dehydrogenase [ubiquinone] cytochrome b small subunit, mitochondrial [Wyeomyia smithii]|uniref:succinate dehydrogenase [ubiquinone] cytochrome b small subunit, mitochondrial n=1 Tax=Wyeomyia smithii TaxID=174621 RepID=UPI002467F355|nr:succinate dehydrogenase [ubiquinone] cytochrome b small subunit, mitochondrial [Wyeomyia smithii]
MALNFVLRSSCRSSAPLFVSLLNYGRLSAPVVRSLVPKVSTPALLGRTLRHFTATPVRRAAAGGNHTTLWTAEKALSLALLGVLPVGMMYPSQATDAVIAVCVVMHFHWGLEAIVTDYVRPILFGHTVPKVCHALLLVVSAATLGGLFCFIHNDIGIANTIRKIWATKPKA